MAELSKLQPTRIWEIFEEITRVPRPSKKEEKVQKYLREFATKNSLEYREDAAGNITIYRPAAPSMQEWPVVILQSHIDMVCEKNSDVEFDFDNDPIKPVITEDGWVKADGTTLGADDGIGMAAALAVLTDTEHELPAIEALFTVDEETGLTGAFNLAPDMITGKYLINLDSEDEGELFIGCAGGIDTVATFDFHECPVPANHVFFNISITGLKGGHSGDDIDKGLGNSNKIITRILWQGLSKCRLKLHTIDGGNLRNAIPREAMALVGIPVSHLTVFFSLFEKLTEQIKLQYKRTEPSLEILLSEVESPACIIDEAIARALIFSLQGVPNGVLAMSTSMPGMVETSTNLASVKITGKTVTVTTSQRSSVDSARFDTAYAVESVFALAGAQVRHSEGYPGWNPDTGSRLLEVTRQAYIRLFGEQPKVRAIHAGLECGLFLQKYPNLEMVSFGPTLRGVHSPDEKLEISTVDKFWKLLIETIKNI